MLKTIPPHAIDEGFVHLRARDDQPLAIGSRLARLSSGRLLCSFMMQSALAVNDFVPLLCSSDDRGQTWSAPQPLWPHLRQQYSIFGSISGAPAGDDLFFFGARTPIDTPGESLWQESNQGLKANELIWARSRDGGATWTDPQVIPMPIPGAAEAPGAMCVGRGGALHVCYAPYNTFDTSTVRNQILCLTSHDGGVSWRSSQMMSFGEGDGGAEAWVIQLADGRLLGTCWCFNIASGEDRPNMYAISRDGGATWSPTRSTGIRGQSTGLAALPDGRALFVYNQRRAQPAGVGLAVVAPDESEFGVQADTLAWTAAIPPAETDHAKWTSFAFGEPAVLPLSEQEALLVLWCVQPDGQGIRWVRVRIE